MKPQELLNHRVSYQVLITFDLRNAKAEKYLRLKETLAQELELGSNIELSKEEGGRSVALPHNTLAVLMNKDASEQQTCSYIEQGLLAAFKQHNVHGRYVILIAQNWAAAAGEF